MLLIYFFLTFTLETFGNVIMMREITLEYKPENVLAIEKVKIEIEWRIEHATETQEKTKER